MINSIFIRLRRHWMAYALVLPSLALIVIFIFLPFLQMFYLSMFEWSFVYPVYRFVGLKNFVRLFQDPVYLRAVVNALLLAGQSSAIQIPIGLALAVLILRYERVGRVFWMIIFLPYVISSVAISLMWIWMYNPYFGAINAFLKYAGLGFLARPWLAEPGTALIALFITVNWIYIGYVTTLSISGLRSIPRSIFDSARVDGLTGFQTFRYIILPLLKELIIVFIVTDLAGAFTFFDIVWVMTGGGPSNMTHVPTTWLYRAAFRASEPGYGSAIGVTIFVFSFVVVQLIFRVTRSKMVR